MTKQVEALDLIVCEDHEMMEEMQDNGFETFVMQQGSNQIVNMLLEHYKKLHLLKPYNYETRIQKTTCMQLLCNYSLGITTTYPLERWEINK